MTRETLLPRGGGSFAGTPTCTLTGAHTPKVLHIVTSENTQVDFMQIIYVIGHNLYSDTYELHRELSSSSENGLFFSREHTVSSLSADLITDKVAPSFSI